MKSKRKGIVSMVLIALVCLVIVTPAQGAVGYSLQCDTEWNYSPGGLDCDQEYDNEDWHPETNTSQDDSFWGHDDDASISLEVLLQNDHNGLEKTLDFEYTVQVAVYDYPFHPPPWTTYKIIEGGSSSTDDDYVNSVSVDYEDEDDRDLTIEVYGLCHGTQIQIGIMVRVFDDEEQLAEDLVSYEWEALI
jgi:hypothetical protein